MFAKTSEQIFDNSKHKIVQKNLFNSDSCQSELGIKKLIIVRMLLKRIWKDLSLI